MTDDGRKRVVIENVAPIVDGGRFSIKRCAGDTVAVETDVFADGHEGLRVLLLHRKRGARDSGPQEDFDVTHYLGRRGGRFTPNHTWRWD